MSGRRLTASGDPSRLSLGKPSFKLRLEAYYRLVAPDTIQDQPGNSWRERFDQIWTKYGGSHEGEKKLAGKLAKKYGTLVVLETVAMAQGQTATAATGTTGSTNKSPQYPEEVFQLNAKEKQSGCIDFLSDCFDPVAALASATKDVEDKNQTLFSEVPAGLLDRVDQFRAYLPPSDPLFRAAVTRRTLPSNQSAASNLPKAPSIWANIAGPATANEDHPYSLLYEAAFVRKRARIRVVTRYLNGIRGTLTGNLVAYDKHMNLLLRDAEEVCCCGPPLHKDYSKTNAEQERERRLREYQTAPSPRHMRAASKNAPPRRRRLPQVIVRGDNVVMVYFAAAEQSAWPVTAKSPTESLYRDSSKRVDDRHRVGTPGSVLCATPVHGNEATAAVCKKQPPT